MLILAATPIGNLSDASPRLVEHLISSKFIAAEDTRSLLKLANALGIKLNARLFSLHEHNEDERLGQILEIAQDETVLVVSDAGMPTVSDPGFMLVRAAVAAGIERSRIVVDPGLGFAKNISENWELVARLDELKNLGLPMLVGASRKRFLAAALDEENPASVANGRRDVATAVLTALLLQRGLWGVRVHNVELTADTIAIVKKLKESL